MSTDETNVLGTELQPCSSAPETGYLRDGHCRHLPEDRGRHEMCAVVTQEFLARSSTSRASIRATAGVSVSAGGSRLGRPAVRRRSC
jgi:uncharacterized protein (DUF2237 family)